MVEVTGATALTAGKAHSLWELEGNVSTGIAEVSVPVCGTVTSSLAVGADGTGKDGNKSFNFSVAFLDCRTDCGSDTSASSSTMTIWASRASVDSLRGWTLGLRGLRSSLRNTS